MTVFIIEWDYFVSVPLGAEALDPSLVENLEDLSDEEMTLRRAGAYTSYVFIGSSNNDDAGSVVSSRSGGSGNRIVVNVKDAAGAKSGSNNCVVLQDGRASNISIVSTESSELGSPNSPIEDGLFDAPPDIPAKIRLRGSGGTASGYDPQNFVRESEYHHQQQRSRGGEHHDGIEDEHHEEDEEEEEEENSFIDGVDGDDVIDEEEEDVDGQPIVGRPGPSHGLASYYTSSLESSTPSRRGRPPVIRAAERHRRQMMRDQFEPEDPNYEYDHFDDEFGPGQVYEDDLMYEEDALVDDEYDPQANYDVRYESEERTDSEEEFVENYPMCQPVAYDSEEYNSDQFSSGDEYFDREEELRGYNRQIDFTLHTIIEESGEDSEYEPKTNVDRRTTSHHSNKVKRNSDPSEMEKYFLYDVGGVSRDNNASDEFYSDSAESPLEEEEEEEEDDYSDEEFEDKSLQQQEQEQEEDQELQEPQSLAEEEEEPKSFDCPMSDGRNTDDSGSVGSESDGAKTPDHKKKKLFRTKNAARGDRSSDRGESDNHGSEDNAAPCSSDEDGSENDTLKRKKNKGRRGSEPSFGSKLGSSNNELPPKAESESPKFSPPITPLPSQIIEVQPATATSTSTENVSTSAKSISPALSEKDGFKTTMSPVRKHKSRDSGFVGSMDDLLRNESNHNAAGSGAGHTSSDSPQSLSDCENKSSLGAMSNSASNGFRLEKVSEVSGEDDNAIAEEPASVDHLAEENKRESLKVLRTSSSDSSGNRGTDLTRKDSFNNWSSDEDTNIMMNRMRAFFRNLVTQAVEKSGTDPVGPSPQLVALEEQLTRLMRSVPGINEDQVKEIVEYLSSEDAWSDSYDSSDYTSSDMDLEGIRFDTSDPEIASEKLSSRSTQSSTPDVPTESADFEKETALMYQKLMAKMQQNQLEKDRLAARKSPTVAAKVMHHISSRLVALMHEVTAGSSAETDQQQQQQQQSLESSDQAFIGRRQVGPPSRRFRPSSSASTKSDASGNDSNLGTREAESPDHTGRHELSKSVELLDRRMSLDDKSVGIAKTSSDYDVWQGAHRNSVGGMINPSTSGHQAAAAAQRRGSLGLGHAAHSGSSSGMSDLLNDDERWSWKGSFESALAVGETRTSSNGNGSKRKSVHNENNGPEIFASVEQISLKQHNHHHHHHHHQQHQQQHQQHQQQHFAGRGSPTMSQGSRRSNRSSVSGSVRSTTNSKVNNKVSKRDSESEEESTQIYPPTAQSSRFGRRSSIPDEVPTSSTTISTATVTVTSSARHSTNSLPRLGTSSIQQKKKMNMKVSESEQESARLPSNIVTTSAAAASGPGVRSARYRPPGYKPPPVRKVSPSAPHSRKSSADSLVRYTGRSQFFLLFP